MQALVEQGGMRCELAPLERELPDGGQHLELIVTDSSSLPLARARCPYTPFLFAESSAADIVDDLVGLGGFELEEVPVAMVLGDFDVGVLLRDSLARHVGVAERREQHLQLGAVPDDAMVTADLEAVRQILSLLLCHALRCAPVHGTVTLSAEHRGHAIVIGTDVAEPIVAVDRGIGLWLVKKLVEAHGGKVWGVMESGRGARFTFTLPTASSSLASIPPRPTVLVVEDDPSIRASIERVLGAASYRVICAADGIEGLELLRRESVQLVILDLMMPRMNGIEFRDEQCRDPFLAMIPTVLITAFDRDDEHLALGTDLCIQKPFRIRELLSLVDQVVRTPPAMVFATDR